MLGEGAESMQIMKSVGDITKRGQLDVKAI